MRKTQLLNKNWQFHLGELEVAPMKLAKKAYAFGGMTESLPEEGQERLPISAGGKHFLKLIAQGDTEIGLRNLCSTDLYSKRDASWTKVNLPHDWKVELPYEDNPLSLMAGSKPEGVAYYRKRFILDSKLYQGNRIILHFDGVVRMADIWFNGAYLGHNNSGYTSFEFDITDMAYYGEEGKNTLLVRAETTSGSEGWWYEGAGIYKDVYYNILPEVHLEEDDIYIFRKALENGRADIGIEVGITNDSDAVVTTAPTVILAGQTITFEEQHLKSGEKRLFTAKTQLENAILWTPENPYLYQVVVSMPKDQVIKNFGVHTFAYDNTGFFLNGEPYELHGVCEHQDFAGVGIALNQDILDYKIKRMKEMGVNAYRSAHHFASKELLESCDKHGILVMNENRIPESSPWRLADLEKMIKKSRMNACIAFWSMSNEELIGNTRFGRLSVKRFSQITRRLDYEHLLVSAELLSPEGVVDEEYLKIFDILGVNYPEAGVMGAGADIIKQNHPNLPMMSTENASYFSTRGIYKDNGEQCRCNNFGSMYSMILPGERQLGEPGVGGTARPEEVIAYLNSHPHMGGVFLWTAFDYFGEPSPFGFPGISSQFGICDINGFPKDYYYYYQAHWTTKPMVHVMPHWNQEGLEIDENGQTPVRIFSNADTVELFVNGVSQGKQNLKDCQANYMVIFEPGELKVIAYKAGQIVAQDIQKTASKVANIQTKTIFEGKTVNLVAITAYDSDNLPVDLAEDTISVRADKGTIIGLGNGDPSDISAYSLRETKLFSGKALAIVRKDKDNKANIYVCLKSAK